MIGTHNILLMVLILKKGMVLFKLYKFKPNIKGHVKYVNIIMIQLRS